MANISNLNISNFFNIVNETNDYSKFTLCPLIINYKG